MSTHPCLSCFVCHMSVSVLVKLCMWNVYTFVVLQRFNFMTIEFLVSVVDGWDFTHLWVACCTHTPTTATSHSRSRKWAGHGRSPNFCQEKGVAPVYHCASTSNWCECAFPHVMFWMFDFSFEMRIHVRNYEFRKTFICVAIGLQFMEYIPR